MTTTLPRPQPHGGLQHEAYFYEGSQGFLDAALPFVRAGVALDEAVLVAVSGERIDLLVAELGADADAVAFADMRVLGRNPARLIPAWRAFLDEHPGQAVRGLGEPVWPGRSPAEFDECRLHEALLNVVFDDEPHPVRLRCPYDVAGLPDSVVAGARRTHPYLGRRQIMTESDAYPGDEATGDEVGALFSEPLLTPAEAPVEMSFTVGPLGHVRAAIDAFSRTAGLSPSGLDDLLLAASEIATNSLRHGGGRGVLRLWRDDRGVVCEVRDAGRIASPLAGRIEPALGEVGGRGLWMANQLCDLVQVRSSDAGTVVRLHAHR